MTVEPDKQIKPAGGSKHGASDGGLSSSQLPAASGPFKAPSDKPPAGKTKKPPKAPAAPIDPQRLEAALAVIKRLLDMVKGKEDVRNRLSAVLNPANPRTSSNLNADQVNMIIDSYWFAKTYPALYAPLKNLADEVLFDMLSLNGYGLQTAIQLTAAVEQSKLLSDLFGSVQEKKSRLPSFKKAETKQ